MIDNWKIEKFAKEFSTNTVTQHTTILKLKKKPKVHNKHYGGKKIARKKIRFIMQSFKYGIFVQKMV